MAILPGAGGVVYSTYDRKDLDEEDWVGVVPPIHDDCGAKDV